MAIHSGKKRSHRFGRSRKSKRHSVYSRRLAGDAVIVVTGKGVKKFSYPGLRKTIKSMRKRSSKLSRDFIGPLNRGQRRSSKRFVRGSFIGPLMADQRRVSGYRPFRGY